MNKEDIIIRQITHMSKNNHLKWERYYDHGQKYVYFKTFYKNFVIYLGDPNVKKRSIIYLNIKSYLKYRLFDFKLFRKIQLEICDIKTNNPIIDFRSIKLRYLFYVLQKQHNRKFTKDNEESKKLLYSNVLKELTTKE